jgi:hypothetical protein
MSRPRTQAAPSCPARRGPLLGWAVAGAFLAKGLLWLAIAAATWAMH